MTLALCAGYFLVLLDVTVVNVTLPSISTALHATSARLVYRFGPWRTAAWGLGLSAVGFAGIALSVGRPVYPVLLVALAVWGSGLGVLTPAIVTAAMRTTPRTPGIASGASNTARQTGGALGVALFAAIAGSAAAASFTHRGAWAIGGSAVVFAAAALYGFQADQRSTLISTNGPAGGAS